MNKLQIIHLLENDEIDLDTELSNIQSGNGINISLRRILLNHDKYKEIENNLQDELNDLDEIAILNFAKKSYELTSLKVLDSINNLRNMNVDVYELLNSYERGDFKKINELIDVQELLLEKAKLLSISSIIRRKNE